MDSMSQLHPLPPLPPLPPLHQSDMLICLFLPFVVGFCLCFIRQLISPVSLKRESMRFRTNCMLCISLLGAAWPSAEHAGLAWNCKHTYSSAQKNTLWCLDLLSGIKLKAQSIILTGLIYLDCLCVCARPLNKHLFLSDFVASSVGSFPHTVSDYLV